MVTVEPFSQRLSGDKCQHFKVNGLINGQKCRLKLTFKKLQSSISNLTISAGSRQFRPAPKEFLNWKNQFLFSQKHSFSHSSLSRHYHTLQPAFI